MDPSLITFDGSECNKIGVSFEAFEHQANACRRPAGTCLANQPDDLWRLDLTARQNGLQGNYFLPNFGALKVGSPNAAQGKVALNYIDTQISSSLITLTLDAANVSFVLNAATGQFTFVRLATFEAGSGNGELLVGVQNTGLVVADFLVSVTKCSEGIAPVVQLRRSVVPGTVMVFSFNVRAESMAAAQQNCRVALQNSLAVLLQVYIIEFNVTALQENRGSQGGSRPSSSFFSSFFFFFLFSKYVQRSSASMSGFLSFFPH